MDASKFTSKQRHQLQAKMTPEMCRAIKRQETNSGLDYWKTGFNNLNVSEGNTGTQDKKPTYRRLTQVNFDFPGLFLPNVGKQPLPHKRKDAKGQSIVLNRTKTSFIPEIKTGRSSSDVRQKSDNPNPSRKAAVTDLTCLQLADTLLSYNKSPLTGVYGTSSFGLYPSSVRSRYVDLFCDKKSGENNVGKDQQIRSNGEVDINETADQERKMPVLMYHTFQPDDNDDIAERHRGVVSPSSDTQAIDIDINAKPQTKPQKSILKNGLNKTNRPSSETAISYTYSTLEKPTASSYQLPGAKSQLRSVSETRIPTSSLYPKIQNDLSDFGHLRRLRSIPVKHESTGAVRNIPVRLEREHTSFGEYKGLETRKRSVRFNAAHEVREYTPCEPISFC